MERIVVAFQNGHAARQVRDLAESAGIAACVLCPTAAAARRVLLAQHISGVVCGFKLPDGTAAELSLDLPPRCGMLLLARPEQLELCPQEGILRLAAPVTRRDLLASIGMLAALGGGRSGEAPAAARHSGEERLLIREAKELLMGRHGMTEELAHRFLQKQSMDLGMRMSQTARLVLGRWSG